MEVAFVILALTIAALLFTNTRTASMLIESKNQRVEDAAQRSKLIATSDRLLAANEEMSRAGVSAERVEEAIRNNPKLLPDATVTALLRGDPDLIPNYVVMSLLNDDTIDKAVTRSLLSNRIQHSWKVVGKLRKAVSENIGGRIGRDKLGRFSPEKEELVCTIITEKCQHCDLIHRYVAVGERTDDDSDEGYFRGGVRVATDGSHPDCIQVDRITTES